MPLPRPRPAEASKALPSDRLEQGKSPPEEAQPKPPEPSACRLALTETVAIAPSVPPITGPGDCGGDDLVRLEAIVLPDARRIAVKPAAILRCKMATAIANWVREDAAPLLAGLGSEMTELDNFDSFECRGRNRVKGAKLSEHAKANALDVRGFRLANGATLSLTDRTVARETREKVLASVCARFSTVLGPASDWYHEDHIHLDLIERRNNYKICQWSVDDPWPAIAPLMPAARPADAPPRPEPESSTAPASEPAEGDAAEEKPPANKSAPKTKPGRAKPRS
ncbi:extensin family protein [Afipia sp. TerB]